MDNNKKNKHLTLDDRIEIEACLCHGMTFKQIAANIGKDQTTVSKEVKKHITVVNGTSPSGGSICRNLLRAPYVCNGCRSRHGCRIEKHYYRAKDAHGEYRETLVESRTGIALNREQFYRADEILYDGVVNRGQHIYQVICSHNLGRSSSSIYRDISRGYLSVSRMDLPRAVKFKPRRERNDTGYVPPAVKKGITYSDFTAYVEENGIENWVEMDTVIGKEGGKVIMTFDFTDMNFMPALLLDNRTAAEASEKISSLKRTLNEKGFRFGDIFELLLTDYAEENTMPKNCWIS